jgi:surface protein
MLNHGRIRKGRKGASALEYGIIIGLISTVSISAVYSTGLQIKSTFMSSTIALETNLSPGAGGGSGGGSDGGPGGAIEAHASCYDPTNIMRVGETSWTGCAGMLIVSQSALESAASTYFTVGGDASYAITHSNGNTYTFGDSNYNVFTGQVTDMGYIFRDVSFNDDIGYWDVRNVTSMTSMFRGNPAFNQDLSGWTTSSVVTMDYMFRDATAFNGSLSGWDTTSVTSMSNMFDNAASFDQNISGWTTASVTDMSSMFSDAISFNQDISGWDTGYVNDMSMMFYNAASFNQNIGGWNTSSVGDMGIMFADASSFNQDLSGWCVSQFAGEPEGFDMNASAWTNDPAWRPQWGQACSTI